MSASPLPTVFYSAPRGLLFKSWDDTLAVVFDPSSAKTHLLSAAAADLLRNVALAPVARQDLLPGHDPTLGELAANGPASDPAAPADEHAAREALDSLERAGLLRLGP